MSKKSEDFQVPQGITENIPFVNLGFADEVMNVSRHRDMRYLDLRSSKSPVRSMEGTDKDGNVIGIFMSNADARQGVSDLFQLMQVGQDAGQGLPFVELPTKKLITAATKQRESIIQNYRDVAENLKDAAKYLLLQGADRLEALYEGQEVTHIANAWHNRRLAIMALHAMGFNVGGVPVDELTIECKVVKWQNAEQREAWNYRDNAEAGRTKPDMASLLERAFTIVKKGGAKMSHFQNENGLTSSPAQKLWYLSELAIANPSANLIERADQHVTLDKDKAKGGYVDLDGNVVFPTDADGKLHYKEGSTYPLQSVQGAALRAHEHKGKPLYNGKTKRYVSNGKAVESYIKSDVFGEGGVKEAMTRKPEVEAAAFKADSLIVRFILEDVANGKHDFIDLVNEHHETLNQYVRENMPATYHQTAAQQAEAEAEAEEAEAE